MSTKQSKLVSHGDIDSEPKEIYGKGRTILRIGNGGAGATGLLQALATDYLSTVAEEVSIAWICNHSRNTQLAILNDYVDIGLTYERDQEALTAAEGWSITVGCAFHDHFCLAGPASDPAGVKLANTLEEAFTKIARSTALFHSRADSSATMWKERGIWTRCGMEPWKDNSVSAGWYKTSLFSPSEAIVAADAAGAYLLIDRSTLLRQTALQTIHNTAVFFEPERSDDVLTNSCYALIPAQTSTERGETISQFLNYMFSDRGQNIIAGFGRDELGGFQLFAPVRDGFTRAFLKGGFPQDGQWKMPSS